MSVARAYLTAARSLDPEAFLSLFAVDAVLHDPAAPVPLKGKEAIGAFYRGLCAGFRSLEVKEDGILGQGKAEAFRFSCRGVTADGKAVSFDVMDVIETGPDGKIRTLRGYWTPP